MSANLADLVDGVPGRFVPDEMSGQLVEAEHLTRYWWASSMAHRRRVLDAGCGIGYGAALLDAAGAVSVTGIDLAEDVISAARARAPESIRFETADVRALPHDDASFDLIVCFEVIEHIDAQDTALGELRRVLAPGGLLIISSPNRDVYVPGNPHHVHELTPDEFEGKLGAHWTNVRLMQQHNFLASTILAPGAAHADGSELNGAVNVRTLAAKEPGEEVYTLALAGDAELPTPDQLIALASPFEMRHWVELYRDQQEYLHEVELRLAEIPRLEADRRDALRRLAEAEQQLSELSALRAELATALDHKQILEERVERADGVMRDLINSPSWRVTAPLRTAKRLAKRERTVTHD